MRMNGSLNASLGLPPCAGSSSGRSQSLMKCHVSDLVVSALLPYWRMPLCISHISLPVSGPRI